MVKTSKPSHIKMPLIIKLQKFQKNKKHTEKSFNHLSLDYKFFSIYQNCMYVDFIILLFSKTICHENKPTYPKIWCKYKWLCINCDLFWCNCRNFTLIHMWISWASWTWASSSDILRGFNFLHWGRGVLFSTM